MSAPVIAYIAMGSNLGDRDEALSFARKSIREFPSTRVRSASTVHETEPVGPAGQGRYLNAVVEIETGLGPRELLDRCLETERRLGRNREGEPRWGPRRLDLDVLLYGDRVITEPGLTIPHPRMHERVFVLAPLAEIASSLVHPVLNVTIESLLRCCETDAVVPRNTASAAVFLDTKPCDRRSDPPAATEKGPGRS